MDSARLGDTFGAGRWEEGLHLTPAPVLLSPSLPADRSQACGLWAGLWKTLDKTPEENLQVRVHSLAIQNHDCHTS